MIRRLLASALLVCALAFISLGQDGGGTSLPGGAVPTPTPTPCPEGSAFCGEGGGTSSAQPAGGPSVYVFVFNGVAFVIPY